jgi:hypothetical protein
VEEQLADALVGLSAEVNKISNAIIPAGAIAGRDAAGGVVASLTEAVMGSTAGLVHISASIESLADELYEQESDALRRERIAAMMLQGILASALPPPSEDSRTSEAPMRERVDRAVAYADLLIKRLES